MEEKNCSTCKWLSDNMVNYWGCFLGQRPPLVKSVDIARHYCDEWKPSFGHFYASYLMSK